MAANYNSVVRCPVPGLGVRAATRGAIAIILCVSRFYRARRLIAASGEMRAARRAGR